MPDTMKMWNYFEMQKTPHQHFIFHSIWIVVSLDVTVSLGTQGQIDRFPYFW